MTLQVARSSCSLKKLETQRCETAVLENLKENKELDAVNGNVKEKMKDDDINKPG